MSLTNGTLKAGVIGTGVMGRNHVRIYSEISKVDLVGVTDVNEAAAKEVAETFGTQALTLDELIDQADLVSIAVPTQFHYEVAKKCIENKVHVLIEKPFVDDLDQGRELIELANEHGVIMQVGHIERFNPAVAALLELIGEMDVIAIEAHRLGPPLARVIEDSVVMDLMIHDIDILLSLVDSPIRKLSAMGARGVQHATAQLAFENGVIGVLSASRLTQKKVRTLNVTTRECQIEVDYIDQTVRIHRQFHPQYTDESGKMRQRFESVTERPLVETGEPLKRELKAFIDAVTTGQQPLVTAEQALRAIEVARQIDALAAASEVKAEVLTE
ncbi:Gfo/Idh/MocA family oxidoreductase [Haladaptatus sp. GCM10025707]|uniref:Gfo/Idh/MocA family protein n=1 Tax=unclassified Haladaptatus TaxID=2622732 RepID=UPI0023E89282|nr:MULTISPECIES: Gfo/Idh/MocA family oxidoreductase [unclassified Haladaptatus]